MECRKKLKTVLFSVLAFSIFTYGYRFANNLFSGDSIISIYQNDAAWEISLGRFFQPLLIFLRGSLVNPWIICILATFWLFLSAYLICEILQVKSALAVVLISGVVVCNPVFISLSASFFVWLDFFTLSLFLSVLSVWLVRQGKPVPIATGILLLCVSMAIYQAYVCVAIVLAMGLVIKDILSEENKEDFKAFLWKTLIWLGYILLAAVLYYVLWKLVLKVTGIWVSNGYNGLDSLGDYSDISFTSLFALPYQKFVWFLLNPVAISVMKFKGIPLSKVWLWIGRMANFAACVVALIKLVMMNVKAKLKTWQRIVEIVVVLLLPLGMGFVSILSKGLMHTLMIYGYLFVYIFCIWIVDEDMEKLPKVKPFFGIAVVLSLAVILWNTSVYANQLFAKMSHQEVAAQSVMTRIIYEVEHTEGYVPGKTPVAFFGSFNNSLSLGEIDEFSDVTTWGMGTTSLRYQGTPDALMKYTMNANMNIVSVGGFYDPDLSVEDELAIIKTMPIYPDQGSIDYVGNLLVVHVGNE